MGLTNTQRSYQVPFITFSATQQTDVVMVKVAPFILSHICWRPTENDTSLNPSAPICCLYTAYVKLVSMEFDGAHWITENKTICLQSLISGGGGGETLTGAVRRFLLRTIFFFFCENARKVHKF